VEWFGLFELQIREGIAVLHPALQWLLMATGLLLLRYSSLVGVIYFGVGILAIVMGASVARQRPRL